MTTVEIVKTLDRARLIFREDHTDVARRHARRLLLRGRQGVLDAVVELADVAGRLSRALDRLDAGRRGVLSGGSVESTRP